jgi:transposase
MEYFAGLDVSMAETHVCVVTRDGAVVHEMKVPSTAADIAAALAQVPACRGCCSKPAGWHQCSTMA